MNTYNKRKEKFQHLHKNKKNESDKEKADLFKSVLEKTFSQEIAQLYKPGFLKVTQALSQMNTSAIFGTQRIHNTKKYITNSTQIIRQKHQNKSTK